MILTSLSTWFKNLFCVDCRLSLWRNFTVREENYWSLTCLEESRNLGLSCYMLLILMITRTNDLLQHKDIIMYHNSKYFILCVLILHAWQFCRTENQSKGTSLLVLFWTNDDICKCCNLIRLVVLRFVFV